LIKLSSRDHIILAKGFQVHAVFDGGMTRDHPFQTPFSYNTLFAAVTTPGVRPSTIYQLTSAITIAIVVPIRHIIKLKTLLPLAGLIPMANDDSSPQTSFIEEDMLCWFEIAYNGNG
jgi:hypothetical protein